MMTPVLLAFLGTFPFSLSLPGILLAKVEESMDLVDYAQVLLTILTNLIGRYSEVDLVELIIYLLIGFLMIYMGLFMGSYFEARHYYSLNKRETALMGLPAVTFGWEEWQQGNRDANFPVSDVESKGVESQLVYGSAIICEDYFKRVVALLRNYFGGNLTTYESLMDRARREAILRMKEKALSADVILNVRVQTASIFKRIGKDENGAKAVEVMAYGTALYYPKKPLDPSLEPVTTMKPET